MGFIKKFRLDWAIGLVLLGVTSAFAITQMKAKDVTVVPSGNITATDVQSALYGLDLKTNYGLLNATNLYLGGLLPAYTGDAWDILGSGNFYAFSDTGTEDFIGGSYARGNQSSPQPTIDGDILLNIFSGGYTGSDFTRTSEIDMIQKGPVVDLGGGSLWIEGAISFKAADIFGNFNEAAYLDNTGFNLPAGETYKIGGSNIIADTLATVTARGDTTSTATTFSGGLISTGQYRSPLVTDTVAGATWTSNWNSGNNHFIVLGNGAHTAPTLSNPVDGATYNLIIKQPPSGAVGTVTWSATFKWPGAVAPTLATANNSVDIISLKYDGTNSVYYADYSLDHR